MKPRILVWSGNAYVYLGITRSIQEKFDCDLFCISNADGNASKYLKDQKIVNFKKTWFFPNYLTEENKKPDTSYLKKFEEKYNIDLWKIIYGDRRLRKDNQRYYNFTRDEHLLIIEQACKFFEKILDEVKPDFLMIQATTSHNDHLLYCMCKALKIKVMMLRTSRTGYRLIISEDLESIDKIESKPQKLPGNKTFEEIRNFFNEFSARKQIASFEPNYKAPKTEKIKAAIEFFLFGNSSNDNYVNYGKSRISIIKQGLGIKHKFRKNKIKSFMDKNFLRTIKNEEFVYFPFHKEPERMLDISAPYYTDQKTVAKNIAKSLPIKYKLYVKDHPAQMQLTTMWKRSIQYYQELLDLPNVEVIHPSVKNEELIKKCAMVFTINGSSSLEALTFNKPSMILTNADFTNLSGITKLEKMEDFPKIFENALRQKVDLNELSEFMYDLEQNSFECDIYSVYKNFYSTFPYPGFLKWPEHPPKKVKNYLDSQREIFDQLADQHLEKIEQLKN